MVSSQFFLIGSLAALLYIALAAIDIEMESRCKNLSELNGDDFKYTGYTCYMEVDGKWKKTEVF